MAELSSRIEINFFAKSNVCEWSIDVSYDMLRKTNEAKS